MSQGNMIRLIEVLSASRFHAGQGSHWKFTGALFAVNYAKLLKSAVDKKVFFHDEQQLRAAILFVLEYLVRVLKGAAANNFYSKEVETAEKTVVALAQALSNGHELELPPVEYSEQDELKKLH